MPAAQDPPPPASAAPHERGAGLPETPADDAGEELASLNEELRAVHAELKGKTDELARAHTECQRMESALRAALEETEHTRAEAEAAGRAKDHFLAVLSHELRTPLTPVLMAVHTLARRADLPPEVREAMEMIQRNVEVEANFVDDLLDITRIARGKIEVVRETMDLHAAVARAVEITASDFEEKKQRLRVALEARAHLLSGDDLRLQQVFWNLLKNASKFTPEGGEISLRSRNEAGGIVVEVSDRGMGINPAALTKIFNPFEQADESVARRFGGLGLGLAIAHAIIEAHGGALRASSLGPGLGATFALTLPLGGEETPSVSAPSGGQRNP